MKHLIYNGIRPVHVNAGQIKVFVMINNVEIMINANVNVKN